MLFSAPKADIGLLWSETRKKGNLEMLKKTLIGIAAIALLAVSATSFGLGPQLGQESVLVKMDIDKTVTFDVHGAIKVYPMLGSGDYAGHTKVIMTHNFPVLLRASIAPVGPHLSDRYDCAISKFVNPMPFPNNDGTDSREFPGSAPGGEAFFLGARIYDVDISKANSAGLQTVAEILLEAFDIPL